MFGIPDGFLRSNRDPEAALVHFNFVTLVAVAYGVAHATHTPGSGLCAMEALVAQLYLAIMIGRMVGLHAGGRKK